MAEAQPEAAEEVGSELESPEVSAWLFFTLSHTLPHSRPSLCHILPRFLTEKWHAASPDVDRSTAAGPRTGEGEGRVREKGR